MKRAAAYAAIIVGIGLSIPGAARADFVEITPSSIPPDVQTLVDLLSAKDVVMRLGRPQNFVDAPTAISGEADLALSRRLIAEKMLGKGYDIWLGQTFETCIATNPSDIVPIPFVPNAPVDHNTGLFSQIDGLSEYNRRRSSGGSLSLSYDLLSFGGSMNQYSSDTYRSTSRYVDAHIIQIGDQYWMPKGSPTPEAVARLASGKSNFAKMCGQRFISKVGFGTALDGQLTFKVDVNQSTSQNDTSVDIGIQNIISVGAKSSETLSNLSKVSHIGVSIEGASGNLPTPEEFIDYVRTFGTKYDPGKSLTPRFIETTPYSQVAYRVFRDFDDVAMTAAGTVQGLSADRADVLQQIGDLENVQQNDKFLALPAGMTVTDELKTRRAYLDRLSKVYIACRAALDANSADKCTAAANDVGTRPPKPQISLINQTAAATQ